MIDSIGSNSPYSSMTGMGGGPRGMARPDPAKMAENLFSQLDTKGQGYIEKSDLQSAFNKISSSDTSSYTSNIDEVFSQLDTDSDGKVTQDELSSVLKNIADQLDSQFNKLRMSGANSPGGMGGMGGMPPSPPPEGQAGKDQGLSKEQLTSIAEEIGSSDTRRSELMKNLVANFDKADTDGDGKITGKEAMAYDQASQSGATGSTSATTDTSATASTDNSNASVMMRIMQLVHAYGGSGQSTSSSLLSTSA